jgi:protein-S-isoprenylcysteine O-methyltransferase Ste14
MAKRLLAYSVMALAVAASVGSLVLFIGVPGGSVRLLRFDWPEPGLLLWDAALSFAFFLQHSGMVRRGFQTRVAGVIPPPYYRCVYSIASGIVLAMAALLWQPSAIHLLVLGGVARRLVQSGPLFAVALFVWGGIALRGFDFFGTGALLAHLRRAPESAHIFVARGPYRWVRHPFYLSVLILIWSSPDLTADRLLFNVLWSAWIVVGTMWEERDLESDFGEPYRDYRRRVPMLIPWRLTRTSTTPLRRPPCAAAN